MSVSRDDFGIAFRSALLQRGATQKFSIFSLVILALFIFFLDVYGFKVVKTARGFINDIVYRVTYLASTPTRVFPGITQGIASHFNLKKENEELRKVIEGYKALDLNLEYISNENKNLKKSFRYRRCSKRFECSSGKSFSRSKQSFFKINNHK